jgi:DMSO reductase iron-sulfur subunit
MSRYGFVINMEHCIGCNACVVSCKAYNELEPNMKRRKVRDIDENLVGSAIRCYISTACNHCEEPACMKSCPTGAYTKDENGIVVHNQKVCIGCKMCAWACPYEAPTYNYEINKMDKCDMCKDRLAEGLEPWCVHSCPMDALSIVDMDEIDESQYVRTVPGFPSEKITDANVRIKLPQAVKTVRL